MKITKSKDGTIKKFEFGKVEVHGHIHYPSSWMITCRFLDIHGERLCSNNITEPNEIQILALDFLEKKIREIQEIIDDIEGELYDNLGKT